MSADQSQQNYQQQYGEEDILVTSPTSYALRESIRRSSSSASAEMNPPPMRTTQGDQARLPRTSSRGSMLNRAPPPPPPQYPPQIPAAPQSGNSTYGMPRPLSNPNLDVLHEQNLEEAATWATRSVPAQHPTVATSRLPTRRRPIVLPAAPALILLPRQGMEALTLVKRRQ
ncbi:hypothetical protein GN244_ATG20125 [Phytophthora infestans]|uniref:Uncharacterized protein n=1 Tax=Phytophthora infestans TaxID=4787 RepID=A0A833S6D0_PHYIN|nr:hypothetical protein GN244_ATG20125 [Phytophthora infestans]